jgi:hypothetical protein
MKLICLATGSLLILVLCASTSFAQAQRTFVSGLGSDSNPCSRTAPCRTFTQAISQAKAGGEVVVLDSAGYSAFSVAKSISIISPPGVYAGVSVFSGDGIDISAGASDVVVLRGLTINSQGGVNGVLFNTGGTLRVEACAARGFPGAGIKILGSGNLVVRDTVISDCGQGIFTIPLSGTLHVTMDHIAVAGCNFGVLVGADGTATILAAIRDSTISEAGNTGIETLSDSGSATALLDVERCLIANGASGLLTGVSVQGGGPSAMSISNCLISHTSTSGFVVEPGTTMFSRGNNGFFGNGPNTGSLTPSSAQ